jgi:hypothetical protein
MALVAIARADGVTVFSDPDRIIASETIPR